MRLFFYYVLHTFKNQLKKLFKTWVLILLVCCLVLGGLIGGLVGLGASMVESDEPDQPGVSEAVQPEPDDPGELTVTVTAERDPQRIADIVELGAGGLCLFLFLILLLGADKNGSKIFLPADVNLLFSAPLKPQSVLMFRLLTQMGAMLAASIYLVFQIPNLVLNLGLSVWAAVTVLLVWVFMMISGKLLQLFAYMFCAGYPRFKSKYRPILYAILALVGGGFFLYFKQSGLDLMPALNSFFNHPVSRYIPFWGWLKAIVRYAVLEDWTSVFLWLAVLTVGGGVLAWLIWQIKADFYEDAMAKSEETAELLAKMQADNSGNTTLRKRKKDRSDRLRRDGLNRGSGANVFFYKAMYNRHRFGHLGFLTKTAETYTVAALGTTLLCRFVWNVSAVIPVALTLSVFGFFRAMGNALSQDVQQDHFLLIPQKTIAKLFWSLLGVITNCALDMLLAMLVACPVLGENPLLLLGWLPFAVSLNLFATTVGAFISFSVPVSAGKTVKQVVQVMFVYFGMLPNVAILVLFLALHKFFIGVVIASVINVLLGALFFRLLPIFVDPVKKAS